MDTFGRPPNFSLRFPTIPDDAEKICFRTDLGLNPESWGWGGDGVTFQILINHELRFEQHVSNTAADQRWHPVLLDLSDQTGDEVRLTLRTQPGTALDFTGDLAGWGVPRIVTTSAQSCQAESIR